MHSVHSVLDGFGRIDDIVRRAKELGYPAFALTDHGVVSGLYSAYKAAQEEGIKFIPGMEAYYHPVRRGLRELGADERKRHFHLTLLAKSYKGYKNLLRLASIANTEGLYYVPQIDDEVLEMYGEDIIVLSGCPAAYIPSLLLQGKYDEAKAKAEYYAQTFPGRFFLEVQNHPVEEFGAHVLGGNKDDEAYIAEQKRFVEMEARIREGIYSIADELGLPVVATNDTHYVNRSDCIPHDLAFAISMHKKVDEPGRLRYPSDQFYMKSASEMYELFADRPDAVANTVKIAEMCDVRIPEIDEREYQMPHFPDTPEGMTEDEYLRNLCYEGLDKVKLHDKREVYEERLEYELEVIAGMGFSGYFLILEDLARWVKSQGIAFGVGRGSAAGSLVSYTLGITAIDPIKYGLLFERFLNPDRVSMPDADLDLSQERRGEVIEYLRNKYGHDNVAQIMTVGQLNCKAALKRVMTAYSVPFDVANQFTSHIPDGTESIEDALKIPEVQEYLRRHPELDEIVEKAKEIEGIIGFTGTHAAGVIIADKPIYEYTAIKDDGKGNIVSQNTMDELEGMGLLKLDVLGIRNLDNIVNTIEAVKKNHGVDIDWYNLPLDDEKTYRLYQRAETDGVFQMEGNLFKKYLPLIRPTEFDDLSAIVALIRPGPLDAKASDGDGNLVDEFIRRKHGKAPVRYLHPKLEPILNWTQGVTVYQEQAMMIARQLAGFTPGEADDLRKVIGRKLVDEMPKQRAKFIEGCTANGIDETTAGRIFDSIETQSNYAFNLSHAVSYAYVSYATAYLKANYPVEFMAALLTSVRNDSEKLERYLKEAVRMGIPIKPPSINISDESFVADGDSIRFGLSAIKGVGSAALEALITDRKTHGAYNSYEEFVKRAYGGAVNKTVLEGLIKSGALDEFGLPRAQMLASVAPIIKAFNSYRGKLQRIDKRFDVIGDWDDIAKIEAEREKLEARRQKAEEELNAALKQAIYQEVEEFPAKQLAAMEKELLGYYAGHHPLDEYRDYYVSLLQRPEYLVSSRTLEGYIGHEVVACGVVNSIQRRKGSNGWRIEALLEDWHGVMKITLFGREATRYGGILKEGNVITVKGRVIRYQAADMTYIRVDSVERPSTSGERGVLVYGGTPARVRAFIDKECAPGNARVILIGATGRRIDLGVKVEPGDGEKLRALPDVHQVIII